MDLTLDPHATLAELQLTLFMAAITALVELAKTTDKDHIKLRALTEVARLCAPPPLPRGSASGRGRERATGFAPSPTSSMPSSSASSSASPTPHGTRSASDGPQASSSSHADGQPHAPAPVARAQGSVKHETLLPRATGIASPRPKPVSAAPTEDIPLESLLPLNRRQRRFLARLEANERKRATPCAA